MEPINNRVLIPDYYSANGILGTGALWFMVFSDRSDGKTFNIKERALRRFYKREGVTCYIRRWKTEFTPVSQHEFFDEIFEKKPELIPKGKFKIKADKYGICIERNKVQKRIIYSVPLSVANRMKSNINPTHIEEIDFDEYFPLDNRYVPNEMTALLEFWNTCDRKRYKVKLGIFGNRIESTAPCLQYFNVGKDISKFGIKTYKNGRLAVQSYSSQANRDIVENSPFMDLIKGTNYESYMMGGILKTGRLKTAEIPKDATIWCGVKTENGIGSIWHDGLDLYLSEKQNNNGVMITDKVYAEINVDVIPITEPNIARVLKNSYMSNHIYMTSEKAWTICKPLFRIIVPEELI